MLDLEYLARHEQQYRETVLYPRLARTARHLRDLELADQKYRHGARRRPPIRWLGAGLVGLGARLVAVGERLSLHPHRSAHSHGR